MTRHKGLIQFGGAFETRERHRNPPQQNGKKDLKAKGGFNGDRTRTEERYEKTRQSRSSLGHYSKLTKAINTALADYLYCIRDRYGHGRLNGLFMRVRSCDQSPDRPKQLPYGLATDAGRSLLLGYQFQKGRSIGANVRRPFHLDLINGKLTLPHFTPALDHAFPKGTKMAGLQLLLLRVDLERPGCAMSSSEVELFTNDMTHADVVLEAPVPKGDGYLFALLFSCYCDMERDLLRWTPRKETVLAFVGIAPGV